MSNSYEDSEGKRLEPVAAILFNDDGTTAAGGGAGTEYTEGDTDASITGGAILWEDTGDTLRSVSAAKPLPVSVATLTSITNVVHVDDNSGNLSIDDGGNSITVDNAGTFAVQDSQVIADNAGFTDGTSKVQPAGFIYDEVAGTALTENDVAAARINVNRALIGIIEDGSTRARYATVTASNALKVDASGVAVPITDNSGSLTVDYATTGSGTATGALRVELANNGTGVLATVGAVTAITNALPAGTNAIGKLSANSGVDIGDIDVTSIIPGTGATNLGKAEDAVHSSGDTGVMALTVRKDTATALAGSDGDYQPPITDASGKLHTIDASVLAALGGCTPFQNLDVDESEDDINTSACNLSFLVATNVSAGTRYVKLYNATAANVTVGSTTPVQTYAIPAGAGMVLPIPQAGLYFSTALTIAATTGVAVADTGAPGTNDVIVSGGYAA